MGLHRMVSRQMPREQEQRLLAWLVTVRRARNSREILLICSAICFTSCVASWRTNERLNRRRKERNCGLDCLLTRPLRPKAESGNKSNARHGLRHFCNDFLSWTRLPSFSLRKSFRYVYQLADWIRGRRRTAEFAGNHCAML